MRTKYSAYLLRLLCSDTEDLIDTDVLSFEEFTEKEMAENHD